MRSIYFYKVDNGCVICVKKISNTINFIDVQTDGIKFSYTINVNFSKKKIELFLKSKFKKCQKIEK